MKKILIIIVLAFVAGVIFYAMDSSSPWLTDFESAKKESGESGKPILLYFSGSDWCGNCMKMKAEVLETEAFKEYADQHLVLMLADFPRMKKNKLDEKTAKQNESLAEHYNPSGIFPCTVLLDSEGKVLKQWNGYTSFTPQMFIDQIKKCS